jgi:hypothetical protein
MHYHPGGFVDHEKVVVFVEDVERDIFGGGQSVERRRDLDLDGFPAVENEALLDGPTVELDFAIADQALEAGAAELRQRVGEIHVNPCRTLIRVRLKKKTVCGWTRHGALWAGGRGRSKGKGDWRL